MSDSPTNDRPYDVFLSHNSKDKDAVRRLKDRLVADGLKVWFDEREMKAGDELHKAIAEGLDQSRVCAVFIGSEGFGPWHDWEIGIAVNLHVNSPAFRLIPVILPRESKTKFLPSEVPLWLRGLLWVEFPKLNDDEPYQRLKDGILGRGSDFTPRAIRQIEEDTETNITPRGLRSFEEDDKHFFLRLVAGPRDHRGLPVSIAFWKNRLEQVDPDKTFRVGLLFGPSGSGKSSLVKAGLLPRLHQYVKTIYLAATPDRTEQQLLSAVRKQVPGLPSDLGLVESLAHLTSHPDVLQDFKLVIVLDQFEQWLHSNLIVADAPLIAALRQCDAAILQAVVMVRADFYVETHRLFEQLNGVKIQDDINAELIDLFDRDHARNVLLEYGRAYGRFTDPQSLNPDEETFLAETLDQLQDGDQRLVAVQLALFADLMKNKPWTGAVLKKLGGATGVGRAFLEENFDAKTANATHRFHRKAAVAVLKELLPPRGAGIKGTSKTKSVLMQAASYQSRPADFDGLLEVLLNDLKLISPVACDEDSSSSTESPTVDPRYQLSHDYLVPSLRDWLDEKTLEPFRKLNAEFGTAQGDKDTLRNRATIVAIVRMLVTSVEADDCPVEVTGDVLCDQIGWFDRNRAIPMLNKLESFGIAKRSVPPNSFKIASKELVEPLRDWTKLRLLETRQGRARLILEERAEQWKRDPQSRHLPSIAEIAKIKLLVPRGVWTEEQNKMMGTAITKLGIQTILGLLLIVGVSALGDYQYRKRVLEAERKRVLESDRTRARELVAKSLEKPKEVSRTVIEESIQSLKDNSGLRRWAIPALQDEVANQADHERNLVARLLLLAVDDQPSSQWFESLHAENELNDATFMKFCWTLAQRAPEPAVENELKRLEEEENKLVWYHDAKDRDDYDRRLKNRIRYGQRRAAVASALLRLQKPMDAINALRTRDDPEAMTQFCAHCVECEVKASDLVHALGKKQNPQFTLLMALGEYSWSDLTVSDKAWLKPKLMEWFKNHESSAIHGVTGWLLRQWKKELGEIVGPIEEDIAEVRVPPNLNKEWFVIKVKGDQNETDYFTFIIFEPGTFEMGSPDHEVGRESEKESRHQVRLERRFAICDRELTRRQFDQSLKDNEPNMPMNLNWRKSVKYCNWLTRRLFNSTTDQCCYVVSEDSDNELVPDRTLFFNKAGFRLPTEAEWEYACRSGTRSPYGFGSDRKQIGLYGRIGDSDRAGAVTQLRPNLRGVFDLHGNACEWCSDKYSEIIYDDHKTEEVNPLRFHDAVSHVGHLNDGVLRGGGWNDDSTEVRCASRWWESFGATKACFGMRLALTLDIEPSGVEK